MLVRGLRRSGRLSAHAADRAVSTVLCALGRRLEGRASEAIPLPLRVRELVRCCDRHRARRRRGRFGDREFIAAIASDLGSGPEEAEGMARMVLGALRDQVSDPEADEVAIQLPPDLAPLWRRVS
jgi:uncharacterized protein (DUF2267 family)